MILKKFHQDTTKLIPGTLNLLSPKELTQYYIKEYQLVYLNTGNILYHQLKKILIEILCIFKENHNEGIKMEITFKRRLTNELMTTYLPSFFLLGICFASTHFKLFYFEAKVTVNLTVMLVSTTLFIRSVYIHNIVYISTCVTRMNPSSIQLWLCQ